MIIKIEAEKVKDFLKEITFFCIAGIITFIVLCSVFILGMNYVIDEKGTITKVYNTPTQIINNASSPKITIEKKGTCISIHEPNATEFEQKCYLN